MIMKEEMKLNIKFSDYLKLNEDVKMLKDQLKCCPMCSSKDFKLNKTAYNNTYTIDCDCGISYGAYKEDELLERWNKRKSISDGYHTFQDLYDHRHALFGALSKALLKHSYKSLKHDNEENNPMFDGMFIAGINLPNSKTITYHLPISMFDEFPAPEIENSEEWDGHTSDDVIKRLIKYYKDYNDF